MHTKSGLSPWVCPFGVVGAAFSPPERWEERSARKPGNQSAGFLSLGQQRPLVVWPVGKCTSKLLKRAYARPSERLRHPRLRHQRSPSNEWHQPAKEEQ